MHCFPKTVYRQSRPHHCAGVIWKPFQTILKLTVHLHRYAIISSSKYKLVSFFFTKKRLITSKLKRKFLTKVLYFTVCQPASYRELKFKIGTRWVYARTHRPLTVVTDREAQFTRVGMRHTASVGGFFILAPHPVEAFLTSGIKKTINILKSSDIELETWLML